MKNSHRIISACAGLIFACSVAGVAEGEVRDARKNMDDGSEATIVFCAQKAPAGQGGGTAFIVLIESAKDKAAGTKFAYGLYEVDGQSNFGDVPGELAEKWTGDGDSEKAVVFTVRVDAEQLAGARLAIAESKEKGLPSTGPSSATSAACMNVLLAVNRQVGLKKPYVSGLSGGKPTLYISDLQKLNRVRK